MSSQVTWSIEKLWVQSQLGVLNNVVLNASWKCMSNNGNLVSGNATFPIPSVVEFTPYDHVTEAQVLSWCWSGAVGGIDKKSVEMSILPSPDIAIGVTEIVSPHLPWIE
jgi:hypothetical protein